MESVQQLVPEANTEAFASYFCETCDTWHADVDLSETVAPEPVLIQERRRLKLADERHHAIGHLRRTLRTQLEITRDQLAECAAGRRREVEFLGIEAALNRTRIEMAVTVLKLLGLGRAAARLVRLNDARRAAMIEGAKS